MSISVKGEMMAAATWGRGREANSPREIPVKGWKDTLTRVKKEVKGDRLSMIAAAMSYYALMAFVPAISSIVLIYAWVSDPADIAQHIARVSQLMPAEMQTILKDQLIGLASKAPTTLGMGAIGSLLFSLWSASKGSKALIEALNIIYSEEDDRGFFKVTFLAIGLTLLGAIMGVLAILVIIGFPAVTKKFEFGATIETLIGVASWFVLLSLFSIFLSVAYRYSPDRNNAKWKWVSWGAVIAALLWAIVSALFSWYATEFGNFNKTYGSMGAIIVLMLWFYLSSYVILLGGEINAELEHQTKKDSTEGAPRPMGNRDAYMADTLGKNTEEIKKN